MFSFTNKVYVEYCLLIVKMQVEYAKNEVDLKNFNSLCHVEFILKLLVWFECVHVLIKFAQDMDVFVCNLMDNVNLANKSCSNFITILLLTMRIQQLMILDILSFYLMTPSPWANFLILMVVIKKCILHSHLLKTNTLSIKLAMMVLLNLSMSLNILTMLSSKRQLHILLQSLNDTSKAWYYDNF
jgi:hypothetical protein